MNRIIISFFLRLVTCTVLFYVYFKSGAEESEALQLNHYSRVSIPIKNGADKFVVVPKDYVHWFYFLNAASLNFGKVIYISGDTLTLHPTIPDAVLLKSGGQYFSLVATETPGSYTLNAATQPPVTTGLYLISYFVIFITLIALPNFITFLFDRHLFQLSRGVRYVLLAAGLLFSTALVSYFYLYHWVKLASAWLRV